MASKFMKIRLIPSGFVMWTGLGLSGPGGAGVTLLGPFI